MEEFKTLLKRTNIKYTVQYLECYFSLIKLKEMEISIFQQKNLKIEFPFKKKMLFLKKKLGNRGNRNRILFKLRKKLKIHHLKKDRNFYFPRMEKFRNRILRFIRKLSMGKHCGRLES